MSGSRMDATPKTKAKKAADIFALRCLNPQCGGLLAYEVDSQNVLYVDLAWTAKRDGNTLYFPCPKCSGKNVVEEFHNDAGVRGHRVVRWQP